MTCPARNFHFVTVLNVYGLKAQDLNVVMPKWSGYRVARSNHASVLVILICRYQLLFGSNE